jgi:hypothetical protein
VEQSAAPPAYHYPVPMTSSSPLARLVAPSLTLVLTAACAASGAPPALPTPAPAEATAVDSLAGPWMLRPARRERAHTIETTATLTSRVDTVNALERVDTLRARTRATTSRVVGNGVEVLSGLLQAYELSTGDSVPYLAPEGLRLPLPFTAVVGARGEAPRLEAPAAGVCSAAAAALQPLRDLWVGAPSRLVRDLEWGDSTTFTICRDSMPLVVRTVRQFRVVGAEAVGGEVVLRIARASRTSLSGDGSQFGETLRIEAEGIGQLEMLVSLSGGEVVRADGVAELTMRMTGRRRVQVLRQSARIAIASP